MTSTELNSFIAFGYMAWTVVYLIAYMVTNPGSRFRRALVPVIVFLWLVHTGAIGFRWWESYQLGIGHAPLSNLYESLVFFAWSIAIGLLVAHFRFRSDIIMVLGFPIVFLTMASTFLVDHEIKPLIPALQSNWLIAHVITCFLGYAGFVVSFIAAIVLLLARGSRMAGKYLPNTRMLDEIVYRSILVGLPLLTMGIITGAAWADYAWGTYWSWDPKETWSLITWLIYSAFLHTRLSKGWSGGRTAILSVLGFVAVLIYIFRS